MLKLCDARDGLAALDQESVDLIVSDVAYRTISGGNKYHNAPRGMLSANDGKGGFKNNNIHISEYAHLLFRVLKDPAHCYIFSNLKNLFDVRDHMLAAGFKLHNILIWKKNTANPNRWFMQDKEYILFFRRGLAFPINDMSVKSVIEVNNIVGNRRHPSEKPVELMRVLIAASSQVGDVVLDPMMGSGTTGVAAITLARQFIGFDNDPEYLPVAAQRTGIAVS